MLSIFFFFSSRRRHTRSYGDWSSDVCSSDLSSGQGERDGRQDARNRPGLRRREPGDERRHREVQNAETSQEGGQARGRSEEHTSELQSPYDLVCRLLLEKKKL